MNDIERSTDLTTFTPPEPRKPLTEQQEDIARLLAHGKSVRQIAGALAMGESTVDYHIGRIARALQVPVGDPETQDEMTTLRHVQAWAYWTYRKGAA